MDSTNRYQHIPAADGAAIPLLCWLPPGEVRGVVQVSHGMGEHAGRYARVARALTAQGYAVYANNHRGHGEAAHDPAQRGEFGPGGFAGVVRDMLAVTQFAKGRHPGLPLVLFGHSMGSFAAQLYALDHSAQLAGLALSGTAATDLLQAGRGNVRLDETNAAVPATRTPFDWLSRDEAEVDKYIADPLCGFTVTPASRASLYADCARTTVPGAFAALRPQLPVYLFTGERDPVNRNLEWFRPLVARMKEAGLANVSFRTYPGARHEVLNETNRDEVTADLMSWLAGIF